MFTKPLTLEEITALPAVQTALAERAESEEARSLNARLDCLEAHRAASDELEALRARACKLDAEQVELDRQAAALAERRQLIEIATQQADTRARLVAKDLRHRHGGCLIADLTRMLQARIRNGAEQRAFLLSLKSRHINSWGDLVNRPDEKAEAQAAELKRQLELFSIAVKNIESLSLAPISPQEIERRARAEIEACGLKLASEEQKISGWRFEKWEAARPTRT